jgi:AcrR family transcriptional regulator
VVRVTREQKQSTRQQLLVAAAVEFGRVGFDGANINAISLAAGFAKGTIYNYFASKEELFVSVVEEASAQVAASVSAPAGAAARERIELMLVAFCTWAREHEAFAQVFVRECLMGTPGLYPRVIAAETPFVSPLERLLAEGAAAGELRNDLPPHLLALALAGLADLTLVQHWASDGASPRLEQIPGLVLQALLGPEAESRT